MGRQFKDASAQNNCQAIHLLLEKTSGCQVHLNIHPSIHPFIHPSIRLSISLSLYSTPQIGGVGGTRALAHSITILDYFGRSDTPMLCPLQLPRHRHPRCGWVPRPSKNGSTRPMRHSVQRRRKTPGDGLHGEGNSYQK